MKAYPLPSRSYGELVCTAGFTKEGKWIRIYPVPLAFLNFVKFRKYEWIELELTKRDPSKDFRPESYRPFHHDLSDLRVVGFLDTKNYWEKRKRYCLQEVYTSLRKLWDDSKAPKNKSLATFKPSKVIDFLHEEVEREWKKKWQEQWKQESLFPLTAEDTKMKNMILKVPFKFSYVIEDDEGIQSTMMIEDWEIGALYWKCLARAEGDEREAIAKVRQKYFNEFVSKTDLHLFLGTTQLYHAKRAKNPFVIVGVFYPPKEPNQKQMKLEI